jgi:phosphoglycerate dehydrogenase-like enzyme
LDPFGVTFSRVARRAREGVQTVEALPGLLPRTDVLVVLLPLSDGTRGLVDHHVLGALPDGALVVNAGRGGVLDTEALLSELRAKRLRAALDVVDPEPLPSDHPLWKAPGVLVSPHVAGDSQRADEAAVRMMGEQLRRLAWGAPLLNVVERGG